MDFYQGSDPRKDTLEVPSRQQQIIGADKMVNYVAVTWATGVIVVVAFAAYALAYGWWWTKRKSGNKDTEDFVTARGTQSHWRIAWSFYAGAVGSWVIVTPSQYAAVAGIVGVVAYAVSCGLPILMIGGFGGRITRDLPHVFSLGDFVGWRFGPIARTLLFVMTMFMMCIFVLAEYTTIGTIFSAFVGTLDWPIIVVIGVLTLTYTAYGGLAVSIATDQVQGVASMLLALTLSIYVAATYRYPIPKPLPANLGPNFVGWVSWFTLPTSLIASCMLNEGFWQRVWASADRRTLHRGAGLGFGVVVFVIFLSGFGGWLALSAGLVTESTNPNVYLMQILGHGPGMGSAVLSNWVGVIVVLLALVMNEATVDSLQNGMAASISGQYLKNLPLVWTRLCVVVLNIPLVIIATRGYEVLALFLLGNLLTSCAILPLIFGLLPGRFCKELFGETSFVLGTLGGVLGLTAVGIGYTWDASRDAATNFASGANWAWYSNQYDWRAFLAALVCSSGVAILCSAIAWLMRRTAGIHGPGVSVLMRIPGMKMLTATPNWTPDGHHQGQGLPVTDGPGAAAAAAAGSAGSKDVLAGGAPVPAGSSTPEVAVK